MDGISGKPDTCIAYFVTGSGVPNCPNYLIYKKVYQKQIIFSAVRRFLGSEEHKFSVRFLRIDTVLIKLKLHLFRSLLTSVWYGWLETGNRTGFPC